MTARERLNNEGIEARTPCCNRKARNLPFIESATTIRHRTCRKCGARWRATIRPSIDIGAKLGHPGDGFATEITWLRESWPTRRGS